MEILTKEITLKLKKDIGKRFIPIGEMLREVGKTDREIMYACQDFINIEIKKFYKQLHDPKPIGKAINLYIDELKGRCADSKIEKVYYYLLEENKIPFQFQYKIGPYRADFLIDGWLVFEIDGPMHNKATDLTRDKHMESLGYKVLRVPAWLAAASHKSVLDEIQEVINVSNNVPRN